MTEFTTRFSVSREGFTFEVVGPEDFVAKQVDGFRESIADLLRGAPSATTRSAAPHVPPPSEASSKAREPELTAEPTNDYPNVFEYHGDELHILKPIPGAKLGQKMLALAQLYLLGKKQQGVEQIPFKEIRQQCEDHGCLNGPNFARALTDDEAKPLIVAIGTGRARIAKLSQPGTVAAKALAASLNTP